MLTIEINGMVPVQANELRCRIEKQFEGIEYRGDVVLSVVNTFVFVKGKSRPYLLLRVFLTGDAFKDSEDIERRLEILEMDIEMLDLRKVIHAKK